MLEEWSPTEEDVEWTLNCVDGLAVGSGTWTTGEILYKRTGKEELTMISRTGRAIDAASRVRTVVVDHLEWELIEDDAQILPDDPVEQLAVAQQEALTWLCPNDCKQPVSNMPLNALDIRWVNQGMQPLMDSMNQPTGEEAPMWTVEVTCDGCDHQFMLKPMHYGLLVGDDVFYTIRVDDAHTTLRVIGRDEVIELVDRGTVDNLHMVGSAWKMSVGPLELPPHMQGTLCLLSALNEEEE